MRRNTPHIVNRRGHTRTATRLSSSWRCLAVAALLLAVLAHTAPDRHIGEPTVCCQAMMRSADRSLSVTFTPVLLIYPAAVLLRTERSTPNPAVHFGRLLLSGTISTPLLI